MDAQYLMILILTGNPIREVGRKQLATLKHLSNSPSLTISPSSSLSFSLYLYLSLISRCWWRPNTWSHYLFPRPLFLSIYIYLFISRRWWMPSTWWSWFWLATLSEKWNLSMSRSLTIPFLILSLYLSLSLSPGIVGRPVLDDPDPDWQPHPRSWQLWNISLFFCLYLSLSLSIYLFISRRWWMPRTWWS